MTTEYALVTCLIALALVVAAALLGQHLALAFCDVRAAFEPEAIRICVLR